MVSQRTSNRLTGAAAVVAVVLGVLAIFDGLKLSILSLLAVVATLPVGVLIMLAGRGGEPDAFAIHFRNDLGEPIVLALCHSDNSKICEHPYYRDSVAAGESGRENIAPDIRTEWAVEDESGRLLRCVVLYWPHYPGADQRLRLSQAPKWSWPCARTTPAVAIGR